MRFLSILALGGGLAALIAETLARRGVARLPILALLRQYFAGGATTPGWLVFSALAGAGSVALPLGAAVLTSHAEWTAAPFAASAVTAVFLTLAVKLALVVFEEVTFRGALMAIVSARAGRAAAIAVSAVVFACAHLGRADAVGNPAALAVWTLDGIAFGAAAAATLSLRAPVVWHFSRNVAIWLLHGQSTIQTATGPGRVEYVVPGKLWGTQTSTGLVDVIAAGTFAAVAVALAREAWAQPTVPALPGTASTGAEEIQRIL